jgi:hypothetical protein
MILINCKIVNYMIMIYLKLHHLNLGLHKLHNLSYKRIFIFIFV